MSDSLETARLKLDAYRAATTAMNATLDHGSMNGLGGMGGRRTISSAEIKAEADRLWCWMNAPHDIGELVNRFLAWPVPASCYPDGKPGEPGRIGTNLLSATEARLMLEHVLGGK